MALTPQQLKESIEARQKEASRTRILDAVENIDQSLTNNAAFLDMDYDTITTCINLDISDEEARDIEKEYLEAGWRHARVSRSDNNSFCIISLRSTDKPSL